MEKYSRVKVFALFENLYHYVDTIILVFQMKFYYSLASIELISRITPNEKIFEHDFEKNQYLSRYLDFYTIDAWISKNLR